MNNISDAVYFNDRRRLNKLLKELNVKNPIIGYFTPITVLHWSAELGRLEIFKSVSATLANIQPKIISGEFKGATPLHYAGSMGRMDILLYITNCLTNINPADDNGSTIMHWAALEGQLEVISFYILDDRLDDKNPPEILHGRTPLHHAAQMGYLEVVRAIAAVISDSNPKDSHDVTPLHLAAQNGHLKIVEYMCDNYVSNVDIKTDSFYDFQTPLHVASRGGHLDVVTSLIQKDADPKIRTINGQTAYDLAIEENHKDLAFYYILLQQFN